jgi:hypothetical protein
MMDLTKSPGFPMVIDYLDDIIRNIPSRFWKRVAKNSMACTHGGQIEYTSSPETIYIFQNGKIIAQSNSYSTFRVLHNQEYILFCSQDS